MTAQVRDIIIIEGQDFELNATPLEAYFDRIGWRAEFSSLSTANWRGYVGSSRGAAQTLRRTTLVDRHRPVRRSSPRSRFVAGILRTQM